MRSMIIFIQISLPPFVTDIYLYAVHCPVISRYLLLDILPTYFTIKTCPANAGIVFKVLFFRYR